MRVIDFHVHLYREKSYKQPEVMRSISKDIIEFGNAKDFEEYLRDQGVDRAVILAEHSPMVDYLPTEDLVEYCKGNDFFIPFASLNPNIDLRGDKKLEFYVKDLHVRGLKLLPSYDYFYPNDSGLYKTYATAERLKVPVMFHIGSSVFHGTRMKYCDPIYLDDVARDFPNMKIIMSHGGRGFEYEKAFFLSKLHENIYIDISGLPPQKLLSYYPEFESNIDKFLFGTDYPGIPMSIKDVLAKFNNLHLQGSSLEKLFYLNAEKIFNI